MSEQVSVCKIDNPFKSYSKDRAEFYSEQIQAFKDTGAPTEAVEVIDVFLFNRSGEFLVQKRSSTKIIILIYLIRRLVVIFSLGINHTTRL
jgi:hypothetical protein